MTNAMVRRCNTGALSTGATAHDPRDVNRMLEEALEHYHLVSPATSCGVVPEGCAVAMSLVKVDPNPDNKEVYQVTGGLGLGKVAINKIAMAAGVSWDPRLSMRLDNGRDPYVCRFQAVGTVRHFDGTELTIMGTKEMDLRPGSAQVEALESRYKAAVEKWERGGRKGYEPKPPDAQIREMRLFIEAHAETKARLRAIRAIGIKTSYAPQELAKPFAVARLMFTGQSSDPMLRMMFAQERARAMLMGKSMMYGQQPMQLGPAMAPPMLPMTTDGEVIGRALEPDDDLPPEPESERRPVSAPEPTRQQPPPQERKPDPPKAPLVTPTPADGIKPTPNFVPNFGRGKGVVMRDQEDENLRWYEQQLAANVNDPAKARFQRQNMADLAAVRAELKRRGEEEPPAEVPPDMGPLPEDY